MTKKRTPSQRDETASSPGSGGLVPGDALGSGPLTHHRRTAPSLKGDSYRLRNRDLGRVPAPSTAGEQ